jgi:SAM-dependent methyltransferase
VFEEISRVIGGRKSPRRIAFNCRQAFGRVDPRGKNVLEIGAGEGVLSAYAAARGASCVVALEPEDAMTDALDVSNLQIVRETIQDYDGDERKFDIVLSWNSINHLDEPMCAELHRTQRAKDAYRSILLHIREMMNPGAVLILADCSRHNLYPMLGVRPPVLPHIEWEKHQSPRTWVELLTPLGFVRRRLTWPTNYYLRPLAALLSNPVAGFFLLSHFRLVMSRGGGLTGTPGRCPNSGDPASRQMKRDLG